MVANGASETPCNATAPTAKEDYRTFDAPGKGGVELDPKKTAVLFIEFQNEFATEGGKLHGSVKEVMTETGMLNKASQLAKDVRSHGVKIFHAPITFAKDSSDNPNKHLGILAGCDYDKLFTRGTWNADICDPMKPEPEDVVVVGKNGLSAFPNTNLEEQLKASNIETIALGGFMANCCVESTMRDACEKGFNVITLTDCVATTSTEGYRTATQITYPFFSTPMHAEAFVKNVTAAAGRSVSPEKPLRVAAPATKRNYRTVAPGRGGLGLDPKKTAVLFIEFQNEFTTDGGKLHEAVKEVMTTTGMLNNASQLAKDARGYGVKIFHAPISFAEDGSDNPNRHLGILAGCDRDKLFVRGSWNADICDSMKPEPEDVVVVGKKGLSAFPNTSLEEQLKADHIETIALGGFMANCCVESTMRDAFEKGFNVITLTDCVATTSAEGYRTATQITYPFFSTPMKAESFVKNVKEAVDLSKVAEVAHDDPPVKRRKQMIPPSRPSWDFRNISEDVYQVGPWFVDVRNSAVGEKIVLGSGKKELRRYLTFAEATGLMGKGICARCDAIYSKKMPADGCSTEPFGWLCNMTVVRLPSPQGGCLIYSPILGQDQTIVSIKTALSEKGLLPVRIVIAPSPQHHLAILPYQQAFPEAFYICGRASGQMPPLTRKRRDLRFDGVLSCGQGGEAMLGAPVCDKEGIEGTSKQTAIWELIRSVFDVCIVDDNRSGEIVLLHVPSKTLVMSDLLYKSNPDVVGPGGMLNQYTTPEWFAEGQEELFYGHTQDNAGGLLPSYRTHPRMRSIDILGMQRSLNKILSWTFDHALACHTDPMKGKEAAEALKSAWAWVWD